MRTRPYLTTLVIALAFPMLALANGAELNIPSFTHLQQKATNSVDITLGSLPLQLIGKLNDGKQNDNADLKQVLSSLKSIRVRSYRFDSDFVYSQTDVDAVRAQLSGSGWSQLVHTRDRKEHKDVDVYLALDREIISGLAIVASEPREFTIVNIVGSITAEQAAKLQKSFATSGVNDFSQLAP